MAEPSDASEAALLESLRRRLYRADATDADRRRFAELQQALARTEAEAVEPASSAPRRPFRPLVAAALAVVLIAAGALSLLPGRTSPSAASSGRVVQDLRTGALVQDADEGAAVPAERDTTAPSPLGLSVDGVSIAAQRFRGAGSAIISIDTAAAAPDGGSLVVVLTSSGSGSISWQAVRPATRENQASYEQVIAMSDPGGRGAPPSSTSTYDGDPPTRIVVQQTGTAPWALTVAFPPTLSAPLR